jgi:hypothetical protein
LKNSRQAANNSNDSNSKSNSNNAASFNYFSSSANKNNLNLLNSIKMLEKDLETFKQLYDEELRKMRSEMEDMYIVNQKLSADNFNMESKLKDFILK